MVSYVWEELSCEDAPVRLLTEALGISPVLARLLCLRGLTTPDAAERFLHPSLDHLHDPFRLDGMHAAVDRLLGAIANGERIVIHGDYDVDGITSTVILRRTLDMLGANVGHFVPERLRDGYGLNTPAIERLHAEGVRLIVSVDCGIRGMDAGRRARELGVDLIITDHHEPDDELPAAVAIINPRQPSCTYPDKNLAGVGVALKLVQALCARTGHDRWLPACVKIAAIGTLADVVPLVGENRVIAKLGLEALSRGPNKVGLRALIEASGLTGKTIDSYHVAFMIAPRINAAGRMSTPDIAMRLLLASAESEAAEARELASQLNHENERRQQEERAIVAEARRLVENDPDIGARSVLVVAGDGWHRGVIGIVASKLVDVFHRPSIVISIDGDAAHGSCRSIPGFDMLGALEAHAGFLEKFGGHRAAAGLTMESGKIKAFRQAVTGWADERLGPDDVRPRLRLDAALRFPEINAGLVEALSALAPYGAGNAKPLFCARDVVVADGPRRLKDRHLSLSLRQDGVALRGVFWRSAERASEIEQARAALDVAFSVEQNTFNGTTRIEVSLADVRAAERGDR
ncbi:MAG: single-stranded-DNA-specific exonuclease RecJ [Acidobacteria bacterium]|nr:single-stranded-DNA-specific exonuclease RecJ [Acidobacteriota bacterium]